MPIAFLSFFCSIPNLTIHCLASVVFWKHGAGLLNSFKLSSSVLAKQIAPGCCYQVQLPAHNVVIATTASVCRSWRNTFLGNCHQEAGKHFSLDFLPSNEQNKKLWLGFLPLDSILIVLMQQRSFLLSDVDLFKKHRWFLRTQREKYNDTDINSYWCCWRWIDT